MRSSLWRAWRTDRDSAAPPPPQATAPDSRARRRPKIWRGAADARARCGKSGKPRRLEIRAARSADLYRPQARRFSSAGSSSSNGSPQACASPPWYRPDHHFERRESCRRSHFRSIGGTPSSGSRDREAVALCRRGMVSINRANVGSTAKACCARRLLAIPAGDSRLSMAFAI